MDKPKIDLHCHLDGSLSLKTIRSLAKRAGIKLPEADEALQAQLCAPDDCGSLAEYLERFDLPVRCLQTEENLIEAARTVVEEAAMEGAVYIELRFAPLLHLKEGLGCASVIESVVQGVSEGKRAAHIEAGVIVCGMRHMPVCENIKMLRCAERFLGGGVCGLDIAGDEAGYPTLTQKALFLEAARIGMPFTVHAGECGSVSNVLDAVRLGALRIGHGIALMKDEAAMRLCADKGICLEMCPTSNIQTKAVDSWERYPFRLFMDSGVKLCINTDNRTVSRTTVSDELEILRQRFGLTEAEEIKLYHNAVSASFAEPSVKEKLCKLISKAE